MEALTGYKTGYKKLGREAYLMYNFVSTKPGGGAV
jgi:hypothetical protein